jgi:hypothetical protein
MRWLCLLLLMPALAWSAGVYRWTDENGKVHFSSTPPPRAAGREEMVAESTPEVAADLKHLAQWIDSSQWKGERDGLEFTLAFHDNGYFVESVRQGGRSRGSFVGKWAFNHRMISFSDIQVYRPGVEELPPTSGFSIEYYREGVMKVVQDNGETAYYRGGTGGSRLSLPAEFRDRR